MRSRCTALAPVPYWSAQLLDQRPLGHVRCTCRLVVVSLDYVVCDGIADGGTPDGLPNLSESWGWGWGLLKLALPPPLPNPKPDHSKQAAPPLCLHASFQLSVRIVVRSKPAFQLDPRAVYQVPKVAPLLLPLTTIPGVAVLGPSC